MVVAQRKGYQSFDQLIPSSVSLVLTNHGRRLTVPESPGGGVVAQAVVVVPW